MSGKVKQAWELSESPVDGFEVTYFTIRSERRVQEIRLKYHVNTKWSGVCQGNGVDFVDQWQVFDDGCFCGRMVGWTAPSKFNHEHDFSAREDAVNALKLKLEAYAKEADKRALEYRELAVQVA